VPGGESGANWASSKLVKLNAELAAALLPPAGGTLTSVARSNTRTMRRTRRLKCFSMVVSFLDTSVVILVAHLTAFLSGNEGRAGVSTRRACRYQVA
jgi:hypothetical protein